MRTFWPEAPLARIVFAIIIGIGMFVYVDQQDELLFFGLWMAVLVGLLSLLGVFAVSYQSIAVAYRYRFLNGTFLLIILVVLGFVLAWFQSSINSERHFSKLVTDPGYLIANVIEPPVVKDKVVVVTVKVKSVVNDEGVADAHGKLLINFLRDERSSLLVYGDEVIFRNTIKVLEPPKNPNEFSYKLYQSFQTIYHRAFLKQEDWKVLSRNQGNVFFKYVYILREKFMLTLDKYVDDKNDFAVATALLLGYRDYMTEDVIRAYSSSGALHVLSVSGLHVGIMFLMFNFLLKPLRESSRSRVLIKAGIVIFLIWVYACLTGLSPSVLRSATMFTMLQLGKATSRKPNTYNVLAGSALLLLLFNPFLVTEIGFRLSYLAVIGIVFLQPMIYSLWVIVSKIPPRFRSVSWYLKPGYFLFYDMGWFLRYWLPDFVWQLVAVSLAAQIATFPLGLFYFHQFPVMFLISNVVIIPLSNLLLFMGTALCAFDGFHLSYVSDFTGNTFKTILIYLNKFIFLIDGLSFALIENISITMFQMVLWYLFIMGICWLIIERRRTVFIGSLGVMLWLLVSYGWQRIDVAKQKMFIVYHVPKHSGMAIIANGHAFTMMDDYLKSNESARLFHVKHHWWACGVETETEMNNLHYTETPLGKIITYGTKRILIVENSMQRGSFGVAQKLKVDVVILGGNNKIYIDKLAQFVEFQQAVFNTNAAPWRIKYWKKDCEKMGKPYWDINEKGAYLSYL